MVHHCGHAATAVDNQHGTEGSVLPHTSAGSAPPVPHFQLAGHELPVQNPSIQLVVSSLSFHENSGTPHGMVEALLSPTVCVT